MPRIPIDPHKKPGPKPCCDEQIPQGVDIDTKLKVLSTKFVPKDLVNNFNSETITSTTYLYADDNGKYGKILAIDLIPKTITWDQLDSQVKEKIIIGTLKQDKLVPGDHIIITENNVIKVELTARDIGALTAEDAQVIIHEEVLLEVSKIEDDLRESIMADLEVRLAEFKEEVNQTIYINNQEIVELVNLKIETKLADVDQIVTDKVNTKLAGAIIDGGLITVEQ